MRRRRGREIEIEKEKEREGNNFCSQMISKEDQFFMEVITFYLSALFSNLQVPTEFSNSDSESFLRKKKCITSSVEDKAIGLSR
jgi:hypothetical protein